jgi:AcrR family transcriptional regulator
MQRNKAATLGRVLQSSVLEFAQKGFHLARVSDIAAAARCSTETIYDVFINKEGLFMAVVEHVFDTHVGNAELIAAQEAWMDNFKDPVERAAATLTAFTTPQVDETFIAILYQVMSLHALLPAQSIKGLHERRQRYLNRVQRALQEGAKQGLFVFAEAGPASEVLCNATGILLGARQQFYKSLDEPETAFETARKSLAAFCAPEGKAKLDSLTPLTPPPIQA